MTVSLVVVCHRSSGVLPDCIASFRSEAQAASVASEVVVVEQSEDPAEAERVGRLGTDRLEVRPNRGYAAGLNAGIAAARGETLLLANPDTRFLAGSLGRLLEAVGDGYDVVGPQLVWDDGGEILFPPAEDPRTAAELWRTLRGRWQRAWDAGLHGALEKWWRVWTADRPVEVAALRGPLLAASRATVARRSTRATSCTTRRPSGCGGRGAAARALPWRQARGSCTGPAMPRPTPKAGRPSRRRRGSASLPATTGRRRAGCYGAAPPAR